MSELRAVSITLLGLLALAAGCANQPRPESAPAGDSTDGANGTAGIEPHVVAYPDPPDPLEPVNRLVFGFNDIAYRWVLVPVSRTYLHRVPRPARHSIGNFFQNLKMPIHLINHLAQLDLQGAGDDLKRFGINTTWGLLGFRDPASERFGVAADPTGFADTLSHHGVGHGVYLTLPFVGPSNVKSGAGLVVDWLLNPIRLLTEPPATFGVQTFDYLQDAAPRADAYPELRAESEDPYAFFRNLHLEGVQRDAEYP